MALEAARLTTWDCNIPGGQRIKGDEGLPDSARVSFTSPTETFNGTYEDFLERVLPEDRDAVSLAIARSVAARGDYNIDFRMVDSDANIRWMAGRGRTYSPGEAEGVVHTRGVIMDVTERRRSEEMLRRYAGRLQTLLQTDQAILQARTPQEVAAAGLSSLRDLLHCRRASIMEFDRAAGDAVVLAVKDDNTETNWGTGRRFPLADRQQEMETLRLGQTLRMDDFALLPQPQGMVQGLLAGL